MVKFGYTTSTLGLSANFVLNYLSRPYECYQIASSLKKSGTGACLPINGVPEVNKTGLFHKSDHPIAFKAN